MFVQDKMKILISHYNGITHDEAGKIPWYKKDSSDVEFFKLQTMSGSNKEVIMGSKTFASLPKPLANRRNIVLNRDSKFYHGNITSIDRPTFIGGACLIGGVNTISSYVSSKTINKYNSVFFLTEYYYIEKFPAPKKHKELFSFLKLNCNVFNDKFQHDVLGECRFDVNMYTMLELY
jgi:dihydrofolate reductase